MNEIEKRETLLHFSMMQADTKKVFMKQITEHAPDEIRFMAESLRKELKTEHPRVMIGEETMIELLACIGMHMAAGTVCIKKERV